MNVQDSSAQWFSIPSSDEIQRKVEKCQAQLVELEQRVQQCEHTIQTLQSENLRLVNRILEAEVAAERYKNLMLRKHISFPFSPMISARLAGNAIPM